MLGIKKQHIQENNVYQIEMLRMVWHPFNLVGIVAHKKQEIKQLNHQNICFIYIYRA